MFDPACDPPFGLSRFNYAVTAAGTTQATASLVSGLDLVITVDTAVCHLAGGLGRPVWVLNKCFSCWRWLHDRSDTDWYPSIRLFRQAAPDDWSGVVAEVAASLNQLSRMNRSHLSVTRGLDYALPDVANLQVT